VVDFGLARPTAPTGPGLTTPGATLGTAGYMPPEQVRGGEVGVAADVYALGATLHEALSGQPPFADRPDPLVATVEEAPAPPSRWSPDVPPALDAVVLRALAKEPRDRHPSARAFARALERFLAAQEAGPARRAPVGVAAAVVGLGALVAVGAAAVGSSPRDDPPAEQTASPDPTAVAAAQPETPTLASPDPAAALEEALALAAEAEATARAGGAFRRDVADDLTRAARLAAPADPEVADWLRLARVDYLFRRAQLVEVAEQAPTDLPGRIGLEVRLRRASALRLTGRKAEARAEFEALAREQPEGAVGLIAAGWLRAETWDYPASNALAERALAVEPGYRLALRLLAIGLAFHGGQRRALELVDRGLAEAPDDSLLLCCAGYAHMYLRDTDAAVAAFSRAIALAAPASHPLATKWRGIALLRGGRAREALLDLDAALDEKPGDADLSVDRGLARWSLGQRERARADWRTAYASDPREELRGELEAAGFRSGRFRGSPHPARCEKTVALLGRRVRVRVRLTGGSRERAGIRRAVANFVEGLAHADVVLYLGHSNYGSGR